MKVKVSELEGQALDWVVAQAVGVQHFNKSMSPACVLNLTDDVGDLKTFCPSRYWSDAAIILKNPKLVSSVKFTHKGPVRRSVAPWSYFFEAVVTDPASGHEHQAWHPDLLMALMHAFVRSKIGDEVEIPDELARAGG